MLLVKLLELGSAFVELDISVNEFRRVAVLFEEVHVKLAGTVGILREIRWFQTNVFQILPRDAKPTMARVRIECEHALFPSLANRTKPHWFGLVLPNRGFRPKKSLGR